jgi:hypothetical protein
MVTPGQVFNINDLLGTMLDKVVKDVGATEIVSVMQCHKKGRCSKMDTLKGLVSGESRAHIKSGSVSVTLVELTSQISLDKLE